MVKIIRRQQRQNVTTESKLRAGRIYIWFFLFFWLSFLSVSFVSFSFLFLWFAFSFFFCRARENSVFSRRTYHFLSRSFVWVGFVKCVWPNFSHFYFLFPLVPLKKKLRNTCLEFATLPHTHRNVFRRMCSLWCKYRQFIRRSQSIQLPLARPTSKTSAFCSG